MARLAGNLVPGVAHRNWRAMLRHGLEAGDLDLEAEEEIDAYQRTGRPRGDEAFIERLEEATSRRLERQKPGGSRAK